MRSLVSRAALEEGIPALTPSGLIFSLHFPCGEVDGSFCPSAFGRSICHLSPALNGFVGGNSKCSSVGGTGEGEAQPWEYLCFSWF